MKDFRELLNQLSQGNHDEKGTAFNEIWHYLNHGDIDEKEQAFEALYRFYYDTLYYQASTLIRKRTTERSYREPDFAHDTFLRFKEILDSGRLNFTNPGMLGAFLYKILQKVILENHRNDHIDTTDIAGDHEIEIPEAPNNSSRGQFLGLFNDISNSEKALDFFNTTFKRAYFFCYNLICNVICRGISYDKLISQKRYSGFQIDTLRQRKMRCLVTLKRLTLDYLDINNI